ncbi:MAG TPA: glycosyltransferase family 2 protein [Edaphobacter sp.]|nr:glycosyltransferase family 2 protein [Edaphobacter sp.]
MNITDTTAETEPNEIADLELSIILPARNEERSLPECLASLLNQSEQGFALGLQWEVIVVNDDSTDRTREIAAEAAATHPGVTVLDAPVLDMSERGGFTGKTNACWAGAQIARGRHLLFTDADTVHEQNDLSRALREADRHKAMLLSYSPRQIVTGFWQHAVMPLIFSELASIYPTKEVSDPTSRLAAANGQFLLVERDAYFSVGGHRAVGKNVLEDVALARNIKRGPRVIRFRYAPEALSTRMYRTTAEMIEGWTKNLVLLFPKPVALALWRILDLLLFFGLPALALGVFWLVPWQRYAILLLWIRTLWRFYSRVARSNFPATDVAISILGVPLFIYLLIRSVIHHRVKKNVAWKGRSYKPNA